MSGAFFESAAYKICKCVGVRRPVEQ